LKRLVLTVTSTESMMALREKKTSRKLGSRPRRRSAPLLPRSGYVQHVLETDFAINHYDSFQTSLRNASTLLLFADNAGEIVFDKLLLETILQYHSLRRITVVVKKLPIINDATLDDVSQIGLADLPNLEFWCVNTTTNGNAPWLCPEVATWIQVHDVVISKGQANYEVLSDVPGIYFLLIAKCTIVAADTGTSTGALILKYNSSDEAGIS
jgi:uncharacterized protein with ATP-grasp and redox domains